MDKLLDGYRRYRENRWPELRALNRYLAERGQEPKTLIIACSDSRVDPSTIFDMGPGEAFVIRNVANLAPPFEEGNGYHGTSAAIEFAVERLNVDTILVLGHAQCGGVAHAHALHRACPHTDNKSFLDSWVSLLNPAIERLEPKSDGNPLPDLERESIRVTVENLQTFPFVRRAMEERGMRLEGARYGVADGALEVLDASTGAFVPVD